MTISLKRDQVIEGVKAHRDELIEMGVASLDLFGSVAHDEARPDSDIDFLVTFSKPIELFGFSRIRLYLEDGLGCSVDLGTKTALKEYLTDILRQSHNETGIWVN